MRKELQRRHIFLATVVAVTCVVFASVSYAGISNTVHNMSITGPGTIKATSETEICVFCHIPHNANPAVPLWNHDMSGAAYTMYDSDYLRRAGYPEPTGLGTTAGNPGLISRLCLSCHDGTVATGAVYIVRGTILGNNVIAMTGVAPTTETMPTTATGYIGTDLTRHHPVGIKYDPSVTISFGAAGSGVNPRTIELLSSPSAPLKLYSYSGINYVECASCHDPHLENYEFLRVTSGTTNAAKVVTTCTSCHDKTGWTGSVHQTKLSTYTDASVGSKYGINTVSSLACINCHIPHKGQGTPYLLRQAEENTCFQGAAGSATGAPCHGTGAATGGKDIESYLPPNEAYGHPTITISGVHTDLDVLYPTETGKGLDWSDSKHAECVDCHNPHRAIAGTHSSPSDASGWYPQSPSLTTNTVSNALRGVPGVEAGYTNKWTVPTTFTTLESASKEYQICFKCHSYYALRDVSGITIYTTSSGATVTDQSMEFNPNNYSAHPVEVTLNNQTGSYAPKALTSSQMKSPWATNVGNQTMYCSDCHGTDNEASGDPRGPHGSSYKFMLKGPGKYWPTKLGGGLWRLNTTDASNTDLFCKNCHPIYDGSWKNSAHSGMAGRSPYCVNCHVAVPHGSKRSRLIGYSTDPAPYNYNGSYLSMRGFKKLASPTSYGRWDCATSCGGHSGSISGADP